MKFVPSVIIVALAAQTISGFQQSVSTFTAKRNPLVGVRKSTTLIPPTVTTTAAPALFPFVTTTTRPTSQYKPSLLFTSASATSEIESRDDFSRNNKRLSSLRRRISHIVLSLLCLTCATATRVWASSTAVVMDGAGGGGVPGQRLLRSMIPWRRLLQVGLSVWTATLLRANYKLKQRQAENPTSEWSRYAQHPAARGRAIMWLMTQQVSFLVASQILGLVRQQQKRTALREYAGRHFANSLLRLGPLYIKLGQIISCRDNMLPPEWINGMSILQDQIPARKGQEALDLAYSTLDGGKEEFDRLFQDFDSTPMAAASLGQVHRAILRNGGNEVAIKVQRPFLRQIYDQDLEFLTTIAKWMDKMPMSQKNVGGVSSSWTKIFKDAEDILYREIDYRDEAANGVRFCEDFGLTLGGEPVTPKAKARNNQSLPSAADWIRTPYVFQNISNERLLVMEYVPSIKITNTEKLNAAGVTPADKLDLADALARAYLRQFCCNLFFSTDPHPGNLGVEITSSGKPRLVLYDFGQAASLTKSQADGILSIIEAIIDMDVDKSIEAFQKMGVLVDGADLDKVRSKVAENYRTGKVKANRKRLKRKGYQFKDEEHVVVESTSTLTIGNNATSSQADDKAVAAKDMEVMSFFTLPAEYAFVARALSQMDGVGKSLDPDFDFISNSAPYIVEIKGADKYMKDEVAKFVRSLERRVADFQSRLMHA